MSSPTRRDEAWHAALVTACEAGLDDDFNAVDVDETGDELGVEVAIRTIRKTLRVMVDFGYLEDLDHGDYRVDEDFAATAAVLVAPGAVELNDAVSEVVER